MHTIAYRPAEKSACRLIATLYRLSSEGIADYIWTKSAQPGEDIEEVGARRYAREGSPYSYRNCTLIEQTGKVLGMWAAFPMTVDPLYVEDDPVLLPYSRLEEDDSYYLCSMAILPAYRQRGVGTACMQELERHAQEKGFKKLSLIVFEQNTGAKRFYDRLGYQEQAREAVVEHPLIHYRGDALLLVKSLT